MNTINKEVDYATYMESLGQVNMFALDDIKKGSSVKINMDNMKEEDKDFFTYWYPKFLNKVGKVVSKLHYANDQYKVDFDGITLECYSYELEVIE